MGLHTNVRCYKFLQLIQRIYRVAKKVYSTYEDKRDLLTLDIVVLLLWWLLLVGYVLVLYVKIKDLMKPKPHVTSDHGKKTQTKQKKQKNQTRGSPDSPRKRIKAASNGFDLEEKIESLNWVMLLTWGPNVTELFANTEKITLAKAKSQLQEQFGITAEQLSKGQVVIHMVEHSEVQWLNGHKVNFGSPGQMYFRDKKDELKSCTMACSIEDYVITSGHGSVEGTKYFKDPQETTLIGTGIFHRLGEDSDIAIIRAGSHGFSVGNFETEVFLGSAKKLDIYCGGKVELHRVGQTITCQLQYVRDYVMNMRGWLIKPESPETLDSLVPGDSGALLTAEIAHNGTRSVKAAGILSLLRKFTTTHREISLAVAFPLGPPIKSFCRENGISA